MATTGSLCRRFLKCMQGIVAHEVVEIMVYSTNMNAPHYCSMETTNHSRLYYDRPRALSGRKARHHRSGGKLFMGSNVRSVLDSQMR